MSEILSAPEFWTSLAFVIVVLVLARPAAKYLNRWAGKKADDIRKRQQDAKDVLKKAENLKKQYEKAYQNRHAEQHQSLEEAENEIQFLKNEADQMAADRMARKNQEIELRLKMIEENGRQDIKSKMLARVVSNTKNKLTAMRDSDKIIENTDDLVKQAFDALDGVAKALKK